MTGAAPLQLGPNIVQIFALLNHSDLLGSFDCAFDRPVEPALALWTIRAGLE